MLCAILIGLGRVVPRPVWLVVWGVGGVGGWAVGVGVRGVLWVWGIGRGGLKKRACACYLIIAWGGCDRSDVVGDCRIAARGVEVVCV